MPTIQRNFLPRMPALKDEKRYRIRRVEINPITRESKSDLMAMSFDNIEDARDYSARYVYTLTQIQHDSRGGRYRVGSSFPKADYVTMVIIDSKKKSKKNIEEISIKNYRIFLKKEIDNFLIKDSERYFEELLEFSLSSDTFKNLYTRLYI